MRLFLQAVVAVLTCSAGWPGGARDASATPTEQVHKAWLGVSISAAYGGVRVDEVIPDTPADMAGIQRGDIIIGIDGGKTATPKALSDIVSVRGVGDIVSVRLLRYGGETREELRIRVSLSRILDEQELLQRRLVDKKAPHFQLSRLQQKGAVKLSDLSRQVVVLEFWEPDCLTCSTGFRVLSSLAAESLGELVVLGIGQSTISDIQTTLGGSTIGITLVDDPSSMVKTKYRCTQVPCVVVVARDGTVIHADSGPKIGWDDVLLTAKRALREPVPF